MDAVLNYNILLVLFLKTYVAYSLQHPDHWPTIQVTSFPMPVVCMDNILKSFTHGIYVKGRH